MQNLSILMKAETILEEFSYFSSSKIDFAIELPTKKGVLDRLYSALAGVRKPLNNKFFFVMNGLGELSSSYIESLGRFFFLKNYKLSSVSTPVILLLNGSSSLNNEILNSWCISQSLFKPKVINYTIAEPETLDKDISYLEETDFRNFVDFDSLPESTVIKRLLQPTIIRINNFESYLELMDVFKKHELSIANKYPNAIALVKYTSKLEGEIFLCRISISYLQNESTFLKMFNELLRTNNESQTILKFYNEQYEVLPLWYKRFGHIIKILSGKRKLKFPF